MRIYAIDDERFMLEALLDALNEAVPQAEVTGFNSSLKLLEAAQEAACDIAFLDVQMPDMNGVELAKKLLQLRSDINIVFVTAFEEYKSDAMDLRVSDYVTKPVTAEKIREAMKHLRQPVKADASRFRAVTFGNFAFYVDGRPMDFHRKKSAELLAYLVDRRGTIVTRPELSIALFEDDTHSRQTQKLFSNAFRTLQEDLEAVGAGELLVKTPEGLAVNWSLITSDLEDFLAGKESLYRGAYMEQYSWGEGFKAWTNEKMNPTTPLSKNS